MPTPIIPVKSLSTADVLYGDRQTSYRWEVIQHTIERNLAVNPNPTNSGNVDDWLTRWGTTRVFNGDDCTFTMTAARDSGSVGWDIKYNGDINPPPTSGSVMSVQVIAGQPFCISANIKGSKAASWKATYRIHDGNGNWITPITGGPATALAANTWIDVSFGFTVPVSGYLVARFQMDSGVAIAIGDTFSGRRVMLDPNRTTRNYSAGGRDVNSYWDGPAHASTSYKVVPDTFLGTLDGVTDGSLGWVQNAAVKGGGHASVADLSVAQAGMMKIGDLALASVRLRPVCVIKGLPDNPLGIFLVSASPEEWDDTGRVYGLELLDKCTVPDQDAFEQSYAVAAGTLILPLVRTILASCGEYIVIDSSVTLATSSNMVWEAGTSKLKIINDLLDVAGYNSLWMDGTGNFQATPRVLPADRPINYEVLGVPRELLDGEDSIYRSQWKREKDSYDVPNKVIAVQAADGADQAALIGSWTNQDPSSPYSYQARGRWITHTVDSVECPDGTDPQVVAFLQKRAQTTLIQMSSTQAQVKVEHLPIPVRVSDVLRFANTKAGVDSRHVITRIDLDTVPLGLMKSTLQEVVSL